MVAWSRLQAPNLLWPRACIGTSSSRIFHVGGTGWGTRVRSSRGIVTVNAAGSNVLVRRPLEAAVVRREPWIESRTTRHVHANGVQPAHVVHAAHMVHATHGVHATHMAHATHAHRVHHRHSRHRKPRIESIHTRARHHRIKGKNSSTRITSNLRTSV